MAAKRQSQKTPEDFVNEIKAVLSANVAKSIQLMTRANDVIKNTVQTVSSVGQASMDKSEVLKRCLNFNVATYSVISDHVLSMFDKLITVAEGAVIGDTPGKGSAEKLMDISIVGQQGEKCSAAFLIQNHYDHAIDVSFEATPLVAEGTAPLPSSHVTFDPSPTTLERGEQKSIIVTANITEMCVPEKTYWAKVYVLGYESKELILSVEVLPRATSKPRAKRAKTRSVKKKQKRPAKSAKKGVVKKKARKAQNNSPER